MKKFWIDVTVGLFVVLGLIALAFLALRVGNLSHQPSQGSYRLKAAFDNVGTVRPGSPVKSAGIVVGRVETISLTDNYQGLITVEMQKDFVFPADSEIQVVTAGLLGEQYLNIRPGVDTEMLKNGEKFAYTQPAIILEQLIGQFMLSFASDKKEKK